MIPFYLACGMCSEEVTFGDLVSELDKHKEEILSELNSLEENQETIQANQETMQANQERMQANQKIMITKIDKIAVKMSNNFAISQENDRQIIQNQVKLILLNHNALTKQDQLSADLDNLKSEEFLTQYISEYSGATRNAENVFDKFEQIPRGTLGTFRKNDIQVEWFLLAALHHTTGLLTSSNELFKFLNGGGIWHGGKSVFEKLPKFACNEDVFRFFITMQKKSIDLFRVAMVMRNQTTEVYERGWAEKFANTYATKYKYCGCPNGLLLRTTGNFSQILNQLQSNPKKTFTENLLQLVASSGDAVVMKKVKNVLEVQNFDINQQSIRLLADYWIEDTQLLKFLHDSNTLSYKNIYDHLERCIDPSSNNGKFFYLVP